MWYAAPCSSAGMGAPWGNMPVFSRLTQVHAASQDGAGNVSSGRYRTSICALPVVSAPSASANQAAAMLAPANAALN